MNKVNTFPDSQKHMIGQPFIKYARADMDSSREKVCHEYGRYLHFRTTLKKQPGNWHEYGSHAEGVQDQDSSKEKACQLA